MKRTTALAAIALLAVISPAASASTKLPSASAAEAHVQDKVEARYHKTLEDYPDANTIVTCKTTSSSKTSRHFKCDWTISLGFSGGFDGTTDPGGTATAAFYAPHSWSVLVSAS